MALCVAHEPRMAVQIGARAIPEEG